MKRALVVVDLYGVLEVFGPYRAGSDELHFAATMLEVWAAESADDSLAVLDMPLRDPDSLQQWTDDPEAFYSVGDEL